MNDIIYRLQSVYKSGDTVVNYVSATDVQQAIDKVLAYDPKIIRVTEALPSGLEIKSLNNNSTG